MAQRFAQVIRHFGDWSCLDDVKIILFSSVIRNAITEVVSQICDRIKSQRLIYLIKF